MINYTILQADGLRTTFEIKRAGKTYELKAVDDVSFDLRRGEILGLTWDNVNMSRKTPSIMVTETKTDDYRAIPYRFGVNPVDRVFIEGNEWKGAPGTGRPGVWVTE